MFGSHVECALARFKNDFIRVRQLDSPLYEFFFCSGDNNWTAELVGPVGSPYEGYKLKAHVIFSNSYPSCGPKLMMLQDVFHPNIDPETKFFYVHKIACGVWNPTYGIHESLMFALETLANPTSHILNVQAALDFKDKEAFRQIVKMKIEMYGDQTVPE